MCIKRTKYVNIYVMKNCFIVIKKKKNENMKVCKKHYRKKKKIKNCYIYKTEKLKKIIQLN